MVNLSGHQPSPQRAGLNSDPLTTSLSPGAPPFAWKRLTGQWAPADSQPGVWSVRCWMSGCWRGVDVTVVKCDVQRRHASSCLRGFELPDFSTVDIIVLVVVSIIIIIVAVNLTIVVISIILIVVTIVVVYKIVIVVIIVFVVIT